MSRHNLFLRVRVRSIYAALWILTLPKVRWWDIQIAEDLCSFFLSLSLKILICRDRFLWGESKSIVGWSIFAKELFFLKNKSLNFIQGWRVALGVLLLVTDALLLVAEAVFLVKVIEWDLSSCVVGLAIPDKRMSTRVIAVVWSTTSSWLELFIVNLEVVGGTAKYSSAPIEEWFVFTLHVLVAVIQKTTDIISVCAGYRSSGTWERRWIEIGVSLDLVVRAWSAIDRTIEVDIVNSHGLTSILFCYLVTWMLRTLFQASLGFGLSCCGNQLMLSIHQERLLLLVNDMLTVWHLRELMLCILVKLSLWKSSNLLTLIRLH